MRPRLAVASPIRPQRSGVSDYTAEFLPFLAAHAEVDLFAAGAGPGSSVPPGASALHPLAELAPRQAARPYDGILHHLGNNHLHRELHRLALEVPGTVLLHEFDLRGCALHRESSAALLRRLDRVSRGFIVHTALAREVLVRAGLRRPVTLLPFFHAPRGAVDAAARAAARAALGLRPGEHLVAALGLVQRHKRCGPVLQAFAHWWAEAGRPAARLVFGGAASPPAYGAELLAAAARLGVADRVTLTGWLDEDAFDRVLLAADVTLNLRHPTRGEESSSLLRILGSGRPAIVSGLGSLPSWPDDALLKVGLEGEVEAVTAGLHRLLGDPEAARAQAERARAHVHAGHAPDPCARALLAACFEPTPASVPAHPPLLRRAKPSRPPRLLWETWVPDRAGRPPLGLAVRADWRQDGGWRPWVRAARMRPGRTLALLVPAEGTGPSVGPEPGVSALEALLAEDPAPTEAWIGCVDVVPTDPPLALHPGALEAAALAVLETGQPAEAAWAWIAALHGCALVWAGGPAPSGLPGRLSLPADSVGDPIRLAHWWDRWVDQVAEIEVAGALDRAWALEHGTEPDPEAEDTAPLPPPPAGPDGPGGELALAQTLQAVDALARRGDANRALALARRRGAGDPHRPDLTLALAAVLTEAGAEAAAASLVEAPASDPRVAACAARLALARGDERAWSQALHRIAASPQACPEVWLLLHLAAQRRGQHRAARRYLAHHLHDRLLRVTDPWPPATRAALSAAAATTLG